VLRHESERQELFSYEEIFFVPQWTGGALLGAEVNRSDEPIIIGIDKEGQLERIGFSFRGGRYLSICGLAGARDGTIAAIGIAYSNDGRAGSFLARIAPDRSKKLVVQLKPFVPKAVTIAPGGEMWTVGWISDSGIVRQYNVLERFDPTGKLVATKAVTALTGGSSNRDATETS
jgi:hypothetical protein